jgi:hypothetical protein
VRRRRRVKTDELSVRRRIASRRYRESLGSRQGRPQTSKAARANARDRELLRRPDGLEYDKIARRTARDATKHDFEDDLNERLKLTSDEVDPLI